MGASSQPWKWGCSPPLFQQRQPFRRDETKQRLMLLPRRLHLGLRTSPSSSARSSGRSAMSPPPILSLALPSDTGRVLSIQSHTVHVSFHPFFASSFFVTLLDLVLLCAFFPGLFTWALAGACLSDTMDKNGYVGNKSAVFPLQLLGYDVDPINSVQFSNHTGKLLYITSFQQSRNQRPHLRCEIICCCVRVHGYPTFKGHVLNGQQLCDLIEGLSANNLLYYTHLLTGYIGSVSFLETVLQVVERLRVVNPGLLYVCDPVMGDEGKLYVSPDLVSVYREKVVPVASMLTPNHFEIELLTGLRITSESDGLKACNILHAAGPSKVVITSLIIKEKVFLIGSHQKVKGQSPQQFKIVIPKIPAYFTGCGDLMTALLLGWSNKYPDNLEKASELAVSNLQAVLQRTLADYTAAGFDPQSSSLEIRLVQSQDDIRNPEIKLKAESYT
ncbi:Phosphomethylpyrimidine kinase [Musa troglodytarum]|uniref:pyridoxal kinase n=1 Tax=Musa troglodytarum TaxID=320322 RepID=A0A9E7EBD7_9LILI|nr:Phosphomethylpyrimidine kinase [Musa troglodytarum]